MRAKRSLGQHFLVSSKAVEGILAAARLGAAGATGVVEIGPGRGALTDGLAGLELPLVLVEKDDAFAADLARRFPGAEVLHEEAQSLDLEALSERRGLGRWLVVGNLPYNVGTEIARTVLSTPSRCSAVVFMLQREVVAKLSASAGEEGYGPLAVWTQALWTPRVLFEVPPGAFVPPPKVTSAVVSLVPLATARVTGEELPAFDRYLRAAFGRPRRTLAGNLEAAGLDRTAIREALEACGLLADVRAGAVPARAHASLFRSVSRPPSSK